VKTERIHPAGINQEFADRLFSGGPGGCRPTAEQTLLLRAACLAGKEAIEAWREWRSIVDIDRIDAGSQRLFPLLYRNLHKHGIEDDLMNSFRSVRRYIWYKNQVLFHHLSGLLQLFFRKKIETMILKGAAMVLLYYRDYGLRYMSDFDLLISREEAVSAITILLKSGWRPRERSVESSLPRFIESQPAQHFQHPSGQVCDLHWQCPLQSPAPGEKVDFRKEAIPLKLKDIPLRAFDPTDQLLHVSVHGASWNVIPPLRWAADAMEILNTSGDKIDWNRFVDRVRRLRLILPARDTMNYLREFLDAPIPGSALEEMMKLPVTRRERVEYQLQSSPDNRSGPLLRLRLRYREYLRRGNHGGRYKWLRFPAYLQHTWGLDHLWQVPFNSIYRGLRRIIRLSGERGGG